MVDGSGIPEPSSDTQGSDTRDDDEILLIVGYSWASGSPEIRTRGLRSRSSLSPAVGFTVNYQVGPEARWHCPGRVPFRARQSDYVDCFGVPQARSKTCVNCAVAEATLAGSLHHAHTRDPEELDEDVAAHLLQPNHLYLAAFRDGSIKVGTSSARRLEKRWLEQGAWMAVAVADATDGIVVRRLEDLVTERLGIAQSVANRRKLAGLISPLEDEVLAERLKNSIVDVHRLLAETSIPGIDAGEQFWSNPLVGDPVIDRIRPYPADLRRDAHQFTIEAMVGRLAVIRRNGLDATSDQDRFAVDIGTLFGLELRQGQFQPVELAIQDSLF